MTATIDKTPLAPSTRNVDGGRRDITWGVTVLVSPDEEAENKSWPIVQSLVIGRTEDDSIDVVIRDGLLSRRHLQIQNEAGELILKDRESTNGTFIGKERINERIVTQDCVIRLGETLLLVHEFSLLEKPETGALVGQSLALFDLIRRIDEVATAKAPILVLGETGTGKELIAKEVRARGGRKGPFVTFNCGAIPKDLVEATFFGHEKGSFTGAGQQASGLWQAADKGTLLLDEVGELPLDIQPTLLRVIESGEYMRIGSTTALHADVQIIAATNVDLKRRVDAGTFRRDLFARLCVLPIHVPPLRARRVDVLLLLQHFLREFCPTKPPRIEPACGEALLRYDWPMNVRELRSLALDLSTQRMGQVLPLSALPAEIRGRAPKKATKPPPIPTAVELVALLDRFNGRVAPVAEHLGQHRKQIYRWIEKLAIKPEDYRKD